MLGHLKALRRWPLFVRLAVATGALALAFMFQIPLETDVPGEPFLLFFLIAMGATVAFGQAVGLLGVALSAVLSVFFFEPGTLAIHHAADLIKIELYALLACGAVIGLARLGKALLEADETVHALEQSERTKSVLLRELAHRVANNFTAVASLIRRKANLISDAEAKSVLNEAVEQVMVMARVHSRLHAGGDVVWLDSKAFVEDLCEDLKVLVAPGQPLAIECRAASHRLSIAQAIPLGLIVNELVTNAIKHAFPGGRRGSVCVRLQDLGEDLGLSVEDNGVGLNGSSLRGTGMGQDLVRALAQQLEGRLEVASTNGGSMFRVLFPRAREDAAAVAAAPPSMLH